jgi:hypothetical protein
MGYTIEKGIAIPERTVGRPKCNLELVEKLGEGDSIGGLSQNKVVAFNKIAKGLGFKLTQRKEEGGTFRVWRVS